MKMLNLAHKRVIITAGASGIGAVMANKFSQMGAKIAICDIDANAISGLNNPSIFPYQADVGSESDVKSFFNFALEQLGGLDVLINNAGVSGPTKPVELITLKEWENTFKVNVTGQFLCVRNAVPIFKSQKNGTIINISSTAGRVGMPLRAPYSASKFSVCGFTEVLAVELGRENIRVNSILPGMVDGPRLRRIVEERSIASGVDFDVYLEHMLHNVSMNTMVNPEEIADVAIFLSSDLAKHISGQAISVCGNLESYRVAPL